jgi:hypothetical protein
LGWPAQLQQTEHTLEPVVARESVASEHVSVQPGQVLGAEETITLSPGPGKSVQLRLRMSLGEPQQYDEVRVDGVPPLVAPHRRRDTWRQRICRLHDRYHRSGDESTCRPPDGAGPADRHGLV